MKRLLKYLTFALLFVSCDKENASTPQDTSGAASYDEQDWYWKKLPNAGGLQIDTDWDGAVKIFKHELHELHELLDKSRTNCSMESSRDRTGKLVNE